MLGLPILQFKLNAFRESDTEYIRILIENYRQKALCEKKIIKKKKGFQVKEKENEDTHAYSTNSTLSHNILL